MGEFFLPLWFAEHYAAAYELEGPIYLVLDNRLIQAFKHRATLPNRVRMCWLTRRYAASCAAGATEKAIGHLANVGVRTSGATCTCFRCGNRGHARRTAISAGRLRLKGGTAGFCNGHLAVRTAGRHCCWRSLPDAVRGRNQDKRACRSERPTWGEYPRGPRMAGATGTIAIALFWPLVCAFRAVGPRRASRPPTMPGR